MKSVQAKTENTPATIGTRARQNRARSWVFTLNNPTEEELPTALPPKFKYLAFAHETAQTTGTPHLQGYLVYTFATVLKTLKKWQPRAHFQQMMGSLADNERYCSKQNKLHEFGTPPVSSKAKGKMEKDRWHKISDLALKGDWETLKDTEPQVTIKHLSKLERYQVKFQKHPDWAELENYWISGAPGTGKSYQIRKHCENNNLHIFDKDQSKWWCNYKHEEYALIDDLDRDWVGKRQLKRWCDRYPFPAQVKNGSLGMIRPRVCVVTSNYTIDEVYPPEDDAQLNEAIKRRFTPVRMEAKYDPEICPVEPFKSTHRNAFDVLIAKQTELKEAKRMKISTAPQAQ